MIAKLKNNTLQIAPKQVQWENQTVINPSEEILLSLGYMPVQYTDKPTIDAGYYTVSHWTQTENAIVQVWTVLKDTRPLSESEVLRILTAQQINTLSVDDNMALRMTDFYPEWETGQNYTEGFKVRYRGHLYKVLQAHTSQQDWTPDATPSLWTEVCETHAGTEDDPIPYSGNMALEEGKYYSQNNAFYLCTRDTGNPVYNDLADLVGLYVDQVT